MTKPVAILTGTVPIEDGQWNAVVSVEGRIYQYTKPFATKAEASAYAREKVKQVIESARKAGAKLGIEVTFDSGALQ